MGRASVYRVSRVVGLIIALACSVVRCKAEFDSADSLNLLRVADALKDRETVEVPATEDAAFSYSSEMRAQTLLLLGINKTLWVLCGIVVSVGIVNVAFCRNK